MKKFDTLVIGGTGFVGGYLVSELVSAGQKVAVLHAHPLGNGYSPGVFYFREDDSSNLLKDTIGVSEKIVIMTQPNRNLLERILQAIPSNSKKTLLYVSTVMVYKGGKRPQKETDELLPINSFAKEKCQEEKIVSNFAHEHKEMSVLITRLSNVYGGLKNRGLIGLAFKSLFEKTEIIIAGDGGQIRDFIFVDDVARYLRLLLAIAGKGICVVNVTTGIGCSIIEVIKMIETVVNRKISYSFGPSIKETYSVIGDNTKLKSMIESEKTTSIGNGLVETYKRYIIYNRNNTHMSSLDNKRILITGGTGSVGSTLVKELLLNHHPKQIRIFSRDDSKQFFLMQELPEDSPVNFLIGDVRDKDRLMRAMENIDIVFHCAALKHVALSERNPFETFNTNVYGTQNMIDCAIACGVDRVVNISTDKAVHPSNIMGTTKLLAEKLILSTFFYKGNSKTKFCCVRFGNVLWSRGSVLPLFVKQIMTGKPITLTDPSMTRFFMSLEEAARLVINASEMTQKAEIFVLKMPAATMGNVVKALQEVMLEEKLIDKPAQIRVIGHKDGERRHEKLLTIEESENALETKTHFIILPNVSVIPKDNTPPVTYEGAKKAKIGEFNTRSKKLLTIKELMRLLRLGGFYKNYL